jgi:hypothetical protein
MDLRAPVVFALLAFVPLSGCTGGGPEPGTDPADEDARPELQADRGAIAGLVIDDVFRPIPGALVLVQTYGFTATTDADGVFTIVDLVPGTYVLLVTASGHEAAPKSVDVEVGKYNEVEITARRVFSENGATITTSYSIFTACAFSTPGLALLASCILDDDSARYGLHMNNFTEANITYMVSEVVLNQADDYIFVVRCSDPGNSFGCGEYAYTNISVADETQKGVYGKIVLKRGDNYMNTWQSHPWNNTKTIDILLFYKGQGGDEVHSAAYPAGCAVTEAWNGLPDPVPGFPTNPLNDKPLLCRVYYGVGARLALQGRIVMTLFLGEPAEPIDTYHALSPP